MNAPGVLAFLEAKNLKMILMLVKNEMLKKETDKKILMTTLKRLERAKRKRYMRSVMLELILSEKKRKGTPWPDNRPTTTV